MSETTWEAGEVTVSDDADGVVRIACESTITDLMAARIHPKDLPGFIRYLQGVEVRNVARLAAADMDSLWIGRAQENHMAERPWARP